MAEALGVADLHKGLRGSLLAPPPDDGAVQAARTALRGALKAAWSQEALRQGVALAKAGDLAGALPCYDQALQLDGGNADALVARGAALANRQQWQRASGAAHGGAGLLLPLLLQLPLLPPPPHAREL